METNLKRVQLPLKFICVQPATLYYGWQIEVMLTNFKDCGIGGKYEIECLFAFNKQEPDYKEKLSLINKVHNKFKDIAKFFYYEDQREYPFHYFSSIRPNVLKQHFKTYPNLSDSAIFYHDCDIVFTKFPDFLEGLLEDDMNWYVSDTKHYISHSYVQSKGDNVLNRMCEIVGIDKVFVREREEQSGGAQYLLKGIDWRFFEKMEKDCEELFKSINILTDNIKGQLQKISDTYSGTFCPNHDIPKMKSVIIKDMAEYGYDIRELQIYCEDDKFVRATYHEVQIWCADMWAMLWSAWMRGFKTNIIKELDFCWATDKSERWHEVYIFHNAGVTDGTANMLFYKGLFINRVPFLEEGVSLDRNYASFKYFSIIKSIGKSSCLIDIKDDDIDADFFKMGKIKRAHDRFLVCKGCDKFIKLVSGAFGCSACGCQTENNILSDENKCPEKKWSY